MLIITGCNGFIGKSFCDELNHKNICKIGSKNSFNFLESFNDWDKVELIIHQGAITNTTENNIDRIYKYNVYFSIKLLITNEPKL